MTEILKPIPENMPDDLKALQQWVLWRRERHEHAGRWTKRPYNPSQPHQRAKTNDPATWGTFGQCLRVFQGNGGFSGIGFVFSESDPFAGVDLDKCILPGGGLEASAAQIVERLNSYTELSPSGSGLHIIMKAKLPPSGRRKGTVEMYDQGRYFTMTGHIWKPESRSHVPKN